MNSAQSSADAHTPAVSPRLVATSSPPTASAPGAAPGVSSPGPAPGAVSAPHSPSSPVASTSVQSLAALASRQHQHQHQHQHNGNGGLPHRPEESPGRQMTPTHQATGPAPPPFFPQTASPPLRRGSNASMSDQASSAAAASAEANNTSYSADISPTLHQSIFSLRDGADVSNNRRTSRRRTGPLSQKQRERAALIRKLGACADCRRRRVGCHPSHHNMTWEDVIERFHRSNSPALHEIAPSLAAAQALSPTPPQSAGQPGVGHDSQEMDIDSNGPSPNHAARPTVSEARNRTPLPSKPRLEKSMSLPGIETLTNELQSNAARMLSTSSRSRYTSVCAVLLFWQDDDDVATVHNAVNELAEVFGGYYHYTLQTKAIPSTSDGSTNSWRWLSRELHDFAAERDQRDVLKIVYYAGHTYLDSRREMVLASSRDPQKATSIRWNGIQQILEEACADTLIIMDAAYYPSSKMVRQTGVLELIASSMSDAHQTALERCAFTKALTELLRTQASRLNPLTAAEAHSALFSNYPQMVRDRHPEKAMLTSFPAPLHTMMSGNSRLPSIYLSPLAQGSPLRGSVHESHPVVQMSIRLKDDNVDVDSWNEWLRLMPEGVKDVKVEGPFRATYR